MSLPNCPSIFRSQSFPILTVATRIGSLAVLTFICSWGVSARATEKPVQPPVKACEFSDTEFDTTTDVHALDEYRDAVATLLKQEKFEELDCLANAARSARTRFPGGGWKLRNIYIGLESPRPGHPTQEDWKHHFELIEQWRAKNPNSIIAPIVLAESYVGYGWDARGTGYSDNLSESGWKLFGDRVAKAKQILDEAAADGVKCPDWYVAMQQVAQGQSWELADAEALLHKAVAFEPAYQYYYRVYADYLLPKWSGEQGDAARFAEKAANQVGGEAGDILYFQIADAIVCGCQDPEFSHFSWPRLQKGHAALEKKYGVSLRNLNAFALMASKSNDWVAGEPAFKQIGDSWDKDVWITQDFFNQEKEIALQTAPLQARTRVARKEAEENAVSPQGVAYRVDFEREFASYAQACIQQAPGENQKFELLVRVGKDGSVEDGRTEQMPPPVGFCLLRALRDSKVKKETPFPLPPHDSYWLIVEIDPATIAVSVK